MKRTILLAIRVLILCSLLFCATGCSHSQGHFTLASSKIFRISEFDIEKADRVKGIEGQDVMHMIIFFPIGGPPTIEDAMNDAMEKGGGDVMTDLEIVQWGWYIPYIYGQFGWSVKGDVVKTRKN